ncbi:MAG: RecQ family ATP-dependent DNA helicase [Cytophagales bacterium]|nr:MAG: RecQ family ATP-dependent DNA helicase [Cytophagales bacterium]
MTNIHQILKQHWGYDRFRPLQEEIIQAVLAQKDVLALLPTGGGKSICFQVPALVKEGICLVISPLIALMKDQVEQLERRGIAAKAIFSGMSQREIDITLDNCIYGKVKFLYVSPERLKTEIFKVRAKKMNICLLAIDEAHCISQWGYDFRPSYLEIATFRQSIPQVPCIALTATATKEVKVDIQEKLLFTQANSAVFQKSFARDNLSYSCLYEEDKEKRLLKILKNVSGPAIVYVQSRKRTKSIADFLVKNKISADFYHAGLSNEERSTRQENWIKNKTRVIVATNAFGMGIDKPDVRSVVHLGLPNSLEAYYQEAGRAGRDETKAYGALLYNHAEISEMEKRTAQIFPQVEVIKNIYQRLANYYKIAVGSGEMTDYDFGMEEFISSFPKTSSKDIDYLTTFYALQELEKQGFIQLNEAVTKPSRILFLVDNTKLYEFQVANANLDIFIKAILRIYGGEIFTNYTNISESQLAKKLATSVQIVENQLFFLQKSNIIDYSPQKNKPQLTFLTPRYHVPDLPFDLKGYQARQDREKLKIDALIHYIKHQKRCRTQLLLAYFDEQTDKTCGVCDNCLQQKKIAQQVGQDIGEKYTASILNLLKEKVLSINDLIENIKPANNKDFLAQIQKMIASGEITSNQLGDLELP